MKWQIIFSFASSFRNHGFLLLWSNSSLSTSCVINNAEDRILLVWYQKSFCVSMFAFQGYVCDFFFSLQMILQNSIWSTMHCSVSLRWMLKVKDTFFFRCLLLILLSLTGWEQDPNLYLSTMQKLETYSLVCFANDTEILNSWASEICRPIKVCSFFCQKTWKLS